MNDQDLFNWKEVKKVESLEEQREALRDRINQLPRFSHKRVELEYRLKLLTEDTLTLAGVVTP